ncbi:MAG: hypothetical protein AAF515_11875 [Pseudomonadota bacterium]
MIDRQESELLARERRNRTSLERRRIAKQKKLVNPRQGSAMGPQTSGR